MLMVFSALLYSLAGGTFYLIAQKHDPEGED
jgi:hypothetical protein